MRSRLSIFIAAAALAGAQEKPPVLHQSIVIVSTALEPTVERKDEEVFLKSLFSRDDQIFHILGAGLSMGQHEGGGKSLEVRRYGFNLDHGGVNGGLKVLVDNVQQNQTTQGHGQGYLGALKGLSPELVDEVSVLSGPFSPEYGDFSGLGVVHIRLKESLPDLLTLRYQGGSFSSQRGFVGVSPAYEKGSAVFSYEGSTTDGPFLKPLGYVRDNMFGSWTHRLDGKQRFGLKWSASRNNFNSSGQLPLDEVASGRLDRFGFLDRGDGGRVQAGTLGAYYRRESGDGSVLKLDGFIGRSLLDLYSNFTFFLNDEDRGDGIQQHDSRLQQGANTQYLKPWRSGGVHGLITAGANLHANQINVGLYGRVVRTPFETRTLAHADVTNAAGYGQMSVSLFGDRLTFAGGIRQDTFFFGVQDRIEPEFSRDDRASAWQPKAAASWTPSHRVPLTVYYSYGRGISSLDARGVVRAPRERKIAGTDFQQFGLALNQRRVSMVADVFLIDRTNELVYIPDDGSQEFLGPTRAYGIEGRASVEITRHVSLTAGMTRVMNAFYKDTFPREYIDRAPHLAADVGLTLTSWRGWSGSGRMRAISGYRLDPLDATIRAAGHTVFDVHLARSLARGLEVNVAVDNVLNRAYWETQNYFESRLPGGEPLSRIHATAGFGRTLTAGLTWRWKAR